MTCDEYWELLSAQTDGELTGSEEQALREHLAGCRSCQAAGAQLAALRAAFDDLEEAPAPEGFARGVMDKIRAEEPRRTIPLFKRPQLRALAGLAACVAAVLCLYRGELVRQEQERWKAVEDFSTDALVEAAGGSGDLVQERGIAGDAPMIAAYSEGTGGCEDEAADDPGRVMLSGALEDEQPDPDPVPTALWAEGAVLVLDRMPEGAEELIAPEVAVCFNLDTGEVGYGWMTEEEPEALVQIEQLAIEQDIANTRPILADGEHQWDLVILESDD